MLEGLLRLLGIEVERRWNDPAMTLTAALAWSHKREKAWVFVKVSKRIPLSNEVVGREGDRLAGIARTALLRGIGHHARPGRQNEN